MVIAANRFIKFSTEDKHNYKIQSLKLFSEYNEIMDEKIKQWISRSIKIPLQSVIKLE